MHMLLLNCLTLEKNNVLRIVRLFIFFHRSILTQYTYCSWLGPCHATLSANNVGCPFGDQQGPTEDVSKKVNNKKSTVKHVYFVSIKFSRFE